MDPATNKPKEVAYYVNIYVHIVKEIGLRNKEAADLLDVPIATWNRMKSGSYNGRIDKDKITRIGYIQEMFNRLSDINVGLSWFKASRLIDNAYREPPVELMIRRGIPAMTELLKEVDSITNPRRAGAI